MEDFSLVPMAVRAVAALAFTLGLMLVAAWLVRRYQGLPLAAKTEPRLKVVEKQTLGPTTTLYLVKHDEKEHLLAITAQSTTLLHTATHKKANRKKAAR